LLAFEDLLLAKVFAEDQILSADLLQKMIIYLDRQGGSLVELMVQQNYVAPEDERIPASRLKMQRYLFMMREAIFAEMLRKSRALPSDLFDQLKKYQKHEGYNRSMKEILERSGYLAQGVLDGVASKTAARLRKHRDGILVKYRQENFAGVRRALTKQSKDANSVVISRAPSDPRLKLPPAPAAPAPAAQGAGPQGSFSQPLNSPNTAIQSRTPAPPAPKLRADVDAAINQGETIQFQHRSGSRADRATLAMIVPDLNDLRAQSDDPYIGAVIGDNYTLLKRLGQGAMGVVYLGQALDRDELVAVKLVLEFKKNPEAISRFKREILATSFFDHENVVQIYEAGETDDGAYFMVLEYVRGEEIRDVLRREKRFSPVQSVELIIQLLEGLSAAHNANIIHKDIKPENLMLTARNGRMFVKIMDFGLARILDAGEEFGDQIYKTMEGRISGSPAYIAPETISGDAVDAFSDIYSVGITFFEFLTGVLPYGAKSLREHIMSHLYKKPKSLKELYPAGDFPPAMQEFIDICLKKKTAERFQSCEEALEFIRVHIEASMSSDRSES
jgi:hypothetical protein